MIIIDPCELNAVIAAIANLLYANLSKREFLCANIFLSELSKTMFSLELLGDICPSPRGQGQESEGQERGKL